jgi:2-polyprenyl-3-methyl-5-hydroxy-6-metoxy-1,4-benzoquinol methylase
VRQRLIFELRYLRRRAPWDTGISPPELQAHLDRVHPGQALDLGCGTGTNAITMAKRGWKVTAVDISIVAIRTGKRKAASQGLAIDFRRGNILELDLGPSAFDLILDIGCFHSLPSGLRKSYADNLSRWISSQGTILLYTWMGPDPNLRRDLPKKEELLRIFSFADVIDIQPGRDHRSGRASAWITMKPGSL